MRLKSNNLTLRQLRAFMAVAVNRSFVAAAKQLFISPSALSETIRQLEEDVGVRLFDRTTRSVETTSAGQEFYADVAGLLGTLDVTLMRMSDLGSARRGLVRVTGIASVLGLLTAPCIAQLMDTHAGIAFEILEDGTSNIMSSVLEGAADIGIGVIPSDPPMGLHVSPLLSDKYGVVARKDHEAFSMKRLGLRSIDAWPYVSIPFGGETGQSLDSSLSPRVRVNNFGALIPLLEACNGISILPYLAAERTLTRQLTFKAFAGPAYKRKVSLIRKQARSLSPAAQLLWDAMVDSAATFLTRGSASSNRNMVEILVGSRR